MTNQQLTELIEALTAERDALLQQANQQLAYLNGKIDLLKEMMQPAQPEGNDEIDNVD